MDDRTTAICRQLAVSLRSETTTPPESTAITEPSDQIVALVKDTLVLMKVLSKFLEETTLKDIMIQVLQIEETKLLVEFRQATAAMADQCECDKAYFIEQLAATMPNAGSILRL